MDKLIQNASEEMVRRLIDAIGDSSERAELRDTPFRVVKSWKELFSGYAFKEEDVFKIFEEEGTDQMIVIQDIEFYSTCEHHILPFYGKGHIGYLPTNRVIGASKLPRLLDGFSRRLTIQERICRQVVDSIETHLSPKGAVCVLEARHLCMCSRGVNKQDSIMKTTALSGAFKESQSTRMEFYSLIRRG